MTNNADFMLNTAYDAYNNGQTDKAETLARQVLSVEPANGDALFLLGLTAYRAKAYEPAEKILYQAVRLYPDTANYELMLASILEKRGAFEEALGFYKKYPDHPDALIQTGLIYARKKKFSFAKSVFLKALELNSNAVGALIGLAQLERKKGHSKKALVWLDKARETAPDFPDAWYQTAIQYRLMHRLSEALEAITRAIELSSDPEFWYEKGVILELSEYLDEAYFCYRQVLHLSPTHYEALWHQGNILNAQGNMIGAESAYKQAIQINPKYELAYLNLASLLYRAGRLTEALEKLREAIVLNPESDTARYNLAVILEDNAVFDEALGLYFNVLIRQKKKAPVDIEFRIASCLRGLYRYSKQGKNDAKRFIKGWIKHFPDSVVAKHTEAALMGKKSDRVYDYVRSLYDVFAQSYDTKMHELNTTVCEQFKPFITDKVYNNVLDLGCGTGACGKLFKKNFNFLTGVDISKEMLKKASLTKAYDLLKHTDAEHFLSAEKSKYDLILASDMTCYIPDLDRFINSVAYNLSHNGRFVFSVETGKRDELRDTYRYVWCRRSVENALKKSGLTPEHFIETHLRREGRDLVEGIIVVSSLKKGLT